MKSNCKAIWLALILLTPGFWATAQSFDYPYIEDFGAPNQYLLGAPDPREGTQILPVGIDLYNGDDVNTIYYGMTPPNSSTNPVLVFVHGYASNASVWFSGEDNMYHDVYQDGYRSAFVSLTPNRHMWTNGYMLERSVRTICQHYGVNDVVLVGWSKGGVDCDAAVTHLGARNRVSRVFTLSSPHNGTGIAELANSILLSLVNVIFWQDNDATKSLTRGYMSYFRSITDNHPHNTTPFTTLGGWGNGPLNRLSIPQGYLYLIDGSKSSGGNDGVVPYQSSKRPGGQELFSGQRKEYGWFGIPYYPGPAETELDHFEVTRGGLVWPHLKAVLNGSAKQTPQTVSSDYNPNGNSHSRMQLAASQGGNDYFFAGEKDGSFRIQILRDSQNEEIRLRHPQTGKNLIFQQEIDDTGAEFLILEDAPSGKISILAEGNWAAMVLSQEGPEAKLSLNLSTGKKVFEAGEALSFQVSSGVDPNTALSVTGVLHKQYDLQLQSTAGQPQIVPFHQDKNGFSGEIPFGLDAGVYSLSVTLQGESYGRTLVSSFAVGTTQKMDFLPENENLKLEAGPNPSMDAFNIHIDRAGEGQLKVFNIFGQMVQDFSLDGNTSEFRFDAKAAGLAPGLYILERSIGQEKVTEKLILK